VPSLLPVVSIVPIVSRTMVRSVVFMKLFGAVPAFKFMALTGHTSNRNSHNEQKKTFHRRAS
jgi:hypothetical protein